MAMGASVSQDPSEERGGSGRSLKPRARHRCRVLGTPGSLRMAWFGGSARLVARDEDAQRLSS